MSAVDDVAEYYAARASPLSQERQMTITTRPATDADTEFAREVHHAAYREVVIRQFGPWDDKEQDQHFLGDWTGAHFDIIMANGTSCGYSAVENRAEDIHVRELVIHPAHQGKGIGSFFLRQVMARGKERGVPVRLGTFHQNYRALAFYERLGFNRSGKTDIHILLEWKRYQRAQRDTEDRAPHP